LNNIRHELKALDLASDNYAKQRVLFEKDNETKKQFEDLLQILQIYIGQYKQIVESKEKAVKKIPQGEIDRIEQNKKVLSARLVEINEALKRAETEMQDKNGYSNLLMQNFNRLDLKDKVAIVKQKYETKENERAILFHEIESKKGMHGELSHLEAKYHELIGETKNLKSMNEKTEKEMQVDAYKNIENEMNLLRFELIANDKIAEGIMKRHDAIEEGLMMYHNKKLQQINKSIRDLWKLTYKGKDIDTIEIKSDLEKATIRSHSFNYRIIFKNFEYFC